MNQKPETNIFPFTTQQITLLLASVFCYLLGAGIARYLGEIIRFKEFWIGLIYILLLMGSGFFLQVYFDPKRLSNASMSEDGLRKNSQNLLAGLSLMAAGSVLAYLLFLSAGNNITSSLFLALIFFVVLLYAVPPAKLAWRGYGDLVLILLAANIVTALAYTIQTGSMHGMIPMISLPLTAFLMAMVISTGLNGYLNAMISGEKNLVIMLGWKLAMDLHDWLILIGYALIGFAFFRGFSWNLIWPAFLSLPFFLFSIFEIHRIKEGIKPRWQLLTFSGFAGPGIMLYGLLFRLWFG
jgi:1,4-dihydroxy-2-naphthoate octaprenyltransferase